MTAPGWKGEVLFEGRNIYDPDVDPVEIRRRIGMVFQKPNPFPKSIFNNITYGPRLAGLSNRIDLEALVEQSLKQAVLWDEVKDILDQSAMTLSGGQQQRLCIARALAMKPDVLLMDEPTSALDPISTAKIEELIEELKKHYTIIIVTHNMQQAARISDKTGFFYIGKLIEYNADGKDFHQSRHQADGRLHHGPVRLSSHRGERTMDEHKRTSSHYERELQDIKQNLLYWGR